MEGGALKDPADQHIDAETGLFLMRAEWDLSGFNLAPDQICSAFEPVARELNLDWQLHFSQRRPKSAIFVSKIGHCLSDLLFRHRAGELRADFSLVISNHPEDLTGSRCHRRSGPSSHWFQWMWHF